MENKFNSQEEKNITERRRRKVEGFHLNIDQSDLSVGEEYARQENFDVEGSDSHSISSYSGDEVREQMRRNSRSQLKRQKKDRKKELKYNDRINTRRFRIIWWTSVALVGIMLASFLLIGVTDMLAMNRQDGKKVTIQIPENPTLDDVCAALQKKGVIKEKKFFGMYATVTHNTTFSEGKYEIDTNMDYEAIINYLGSMSNRTDTVKVTIPEGMSVVEIANYLVKKEVLSDTSRFLELCNSDYFDEDYDFIRAIKNPEKRYYKLEGYLFPDTYECYVHERPELTITRMLNDYETRIYTDQNVSGYSRTINIRKLVKSSKYSMNQVLTLASIIQAEAANADDMYYISSILHNRLEKGVEYGVAQLGLDSTKYYPYRTKKDVPESMRKTFKSTYDTYKLKGLPAGPICNPGMEAILAAIYPKNTNYLYFCHDKNGKPYYASTLWEQNYNLSLIS